MLFISAIINYADETAAHIIEKIKKGDKQLKEKFIEDYIPFILKVVSSFYSSKIVDMKNSDEYSIGLMAFDEAIEKYDSTKGKSFIKFAEMVIKRRMVDYFRKISAVCQKEIPFSYFENENEFENHINPFGAGNELDRYELICELKDFSKQLKDFGLNIENLPDYMPKHKDSKQICIGIAKKIVENKVIYDKLKNKKYFYMKELSKIIDVHPKTVERNREFIICLCLIYGNDYRNFKKYLNKIC
ncbi:RNA polymerase sigma-I factor [Acetivibrio clariflavus]|uniref:RNA polymerase sigma factor SigI n=1 Tax=Acetivibrio clariflavus (strain DSM 19732 / NBRC 101661 / EBR45) TaxID=720554 RepID=G8LWM8_ACECE|nr:RNA polymerase sigma-I factor [Acetivibrio clariflavus]AEV68696.1 RNA polymerase sigma-I factor [Acetivibrio clariflavus DSM 19732]